MDLPPSVKIQILDQEDRPLEIHIKDFLDLACLTNFTDHALCVFLKTSLNDRSWARLPKGGHENNFAAYVEWVLFHNNSPFTVGPADGEFAASPTSPPETDMPTPSTDLEPTVGGEPGNATSESERTPEPSVAEIPDPSPDQVREPSCLGFAAGAAEDVEEDIHLHAAEGEHITSLGEIFSDCAMDISLSSSAPLVSSSSSSSQLDPPNLPLPPPLPTSASLKQRCKE